MRRVIPRMRTKLGAVGLLLTLALAVSGGMRAPAQSSGESSTLAATTSTPAEVTLSVSGEGLATLNLSLADLLKLPRIEVRAKGHDDKESDYAGTPLVEILRAAGMKFDPGAMPGRGAMTSYVVIEAADGYKVVYALGEIDPTLTNRVVVLADRKDGQAMAAPEGPLRIVAPGDKRAARWIRQVKAISVHKG